MANDSNEKAAAAVNRFVARFDESYRLLAGYAALPLILTPELLNYLHSRFLHDQVPWVAEADVLLSDLCQRVGYEQYVMDAGVRAHLIAKMSSEPDGRQRMLEVARLLVRYVEHLGRTNPFISEQDLQQQQWAALVCLDEHRVAGEIAQSFQQMLASAGEKGEAGRTELLSLANLTQRFAPQLQAHPELIEYAKNVGQVLRQPKLDAQAIQKQRLDQPAVVGGRTLTAPASLRGPAATPLASKAPAAPVDNVPGYENDIFVSYAHVDNIPLSGISKGWVEMFIDNLSTKLAQRIARMVRCKLWDDRLLARNAPLTPEILYVLKASATVVLVLSPGYLKSPWCQRENNGFSDLLKSKDRSSNSVFVVHRDRVERESCPEEIRELLGFRFWGRSAVRAKRRESRASRFPTR